jgi:ABC-type dipeptide/oligopeptide/nickel transport system permease subunit
MSQAGAITQALREPRSRKSRWKILRSAFKNRLMLVGSLICLPIVVLAIVGPSVTPYDPLAINVLDKLAPPSGRHWMGADNLGRDILSRVIYGARVSLQVGAVSVVLGLVVGTALGAISGYLGGWVDGLLMRIMDAIQAFPAMLLALVLVAILGPGLFTVMTAVAAIRIPVFARTVRSSVLSEREKEYIDAARSLGKRETFILVRHIMPNIISPIVVLGTSYFAMAIVVEASLSFLGLGVVPPDVSWGTMLNESRQYMERYPWAPLFPGAAISLAVLGFNLLGDGVRDLLDPRLRSAL